MVKCADAIFLTRNGFLFSTVPLDLLEEVCNRRNELMNKGAKEIVFSVNLERENGSYAFSASDILIRVG
jgi:hypothetical protein